MLSQNTQKAGCRGCFYVVQMKHSQVLTVGHCSVCDLLGSCYQLQCRNVAACKQSARQHGEPCIATSMIVDTLSCKSQASHKLLCSRLYPVMHAALSINFWHQCTKEWLPTHQHLTGPSQGYVGDLHRRQSGPHKEFTSFSHRTSRDPREIHLSHPK